MKKRKAFSIFSLVPTVLLTLMVSAGTAKPPVSVSQDSEEADKTLSPYFLIKEADPEVDRLPLKSTSAQVSVAGVIADVVVTQVYQNEGKKPLEAIYVFPGSVRAAVYGMKMTIGERTIIAKVEEREQARMDYERARQEGRSASLLEQQRPNVFQMNVANILPGDVIKVELKYTELLVPTAGIYDFIYPTVVGPRYSNQPASTAPPSEMWVQNPYLHEGEPPTYAFDIKLNLAAGVPIQEITSPSHKVQVQYGASSASIRLDPAESSGGNRDFVLKYRLAGGRIESGLLLYAGEKEDFFLLMMQPPKRVTIHQIPRREYIFIVDVSGSMHGFPLEISKRLLRDLIGSLRPIDTFNVLLFAGSSSLLAERSLPATGENIQRAIQVIERQQGGGGTELLPALKRALSLPRSEGTSRSLVIATDGYVTVEKEAFDLIRDHLGDANMFPFGIGTSVNRFLIEGMARAGMGEPFVITKPEAAPAKAEEFRKLIGSPVLTQIKVDFGKFGVYEVEPPSIPDLLAERPLVVFGKWRGRPQGEITLRGMTAGQPYWKKIEVGKVHPVASNAALRYLWARHRIATLGDYHQLSPDSAHVKEITRLGLSYNLLTAYTSFVAIDTQVRVKNGQAVTVKQPLPLPEGVSDLAVGATEAKAAKGGRFLASAPAPSLDQSLRRAERAKEQEIAKPGGDKNGQSSSAQRQVRLGEITVKGGLSQEEVKRFLEKQLPSLRLCLEQSLQKEPGWKGKLVLEITIDPQGKPSRVKVSQSDLQGRGRDLEQCIIKQLQALRFSPPVGGGQAIASVALHLS